jgi:hypothetical protein
MTPKEIMSFQGHEFTYVFEDGDTMPAYIKKIDLDKNFMSCWSFSLVTDNGIEFSPLDDEEKAEGACCLFWENNLPGIIELLMGIKTTGKHLYQKTGIGSFEGCPF